MLSKFLEQQCKKNNEKKLPMKQLPSKVAYFSLMKKSLTGLMTKTAQNLISCSEMWHIDKLYIKLGASPVCYCFALLASSALHSKGNADGALAKVS